MAPGIPRDLAQSQMWASQRPVRRYWDTPKKLELFDFGPERFERFLTSVPGAEAVRVSLGSGGGVGEGGVGEGAPASDLVAFGITALML